MKPIRIVTPPLGANVYLIIDERVALIDAGGDAGFLIKALQRYVNPKEIEYLFLTHSHFDHAMAVPEVKRFGCKVVMHSMELDLLNRGLTKLGYVYHFKPDILVFGGETFELGELKLEVIHTPGHTSGSVCYYEPKRKWLFSGDTVFKFGFGRYDFPSGNPYDLLKSLEILRRLNVESLYPGHDDIVEGEARIYIEKNMEILKSLMG
ncbi:MAG: MBL fold metallo-hydrolase [Archaeoglobales archaeon]|nr:MAG: MBL fold metallo-hydrolase [Archaeoglobales archaeon]